MDPFNQGYSNSGFREQDYPHLDLNLARSRYIEGEGKAHAERIAERVPVYIHPDPSKPYTGSHLKTRIVLLIAVPVIWSRFVGLDMEVPVLIIGFSVMYLLCFGRPTYRAVRSVFRLFK